MLLDKLDLYLLRLPLAKATVVGDKTVEYCDTVFSRIEGGNQVGWGEVAPGNTPYQTGEWSSGVFHFAKEVLGPLFISQTGYENSKSIEEGFAPIRDNRQAKALFDFAWWDLDAKLNKEPLWKRLGGTKRPLEVGLTFDRTEDPDLFYKELNRVQNDQFRRITLKFRPGWDIQIVAAVRAECPPHIRLQIDVEGALQLDTHSEMFYRLEDFFLTLIEQPFAAEDAVAPAMLREMVKTPLCLDESIQSLLQASIAIDLESTNYFCMKPGRMGGLTGAKAITDLAAAKSVGCYGGFDLQSSLGYRHLLALASLDNFVLPCDYLRFDELFIEEPFSPILASIHQEEGDNPAFAHFGPEAKFFQAIELWDEPGIGVEPTEEILNKYTVDRVSFQR